jgi:hypothetical protein
MHSPVASRLDAWAGHCPESMITIVLSTREGFATSLGPQCDDLSAGKWWRRLRSSEGPEEPDSSQVEHLK